MSTTRLAWLLSPGTITPAIFSPETATSAWTTLPSVTTMPPFKRRSTANVFLLVRALLQGLPHALRRQRQSPHACTRRATQRVGQTGGNRIQRPFATSFGPIGSCAVLILNEQKVDLRCKIGQARDTIGEQISIH